MMHKPIDEVEMYFIAKDTISAESWDRDYYEALLYMPTPEERHQLEQHLAELPDDPEAEVELDRDAYERWIIELKLTTPTEAEALEYRESLDRVLDTIADYQQWL